jgi:hypothetical protein
MDSKSAKTVTESFTLPETEQVILRELGIKYPNIQPALKKSEAIRVGLTVFAGLTERRIESILVKELGRLVVGRPASDGTLNRGSARLNEKQWESVRRLIKPKTEDGSSTRDILNGLLFAFATVPAQTKLPKTLPDYSKCMGQLKKWKASGRWPKICSKLIECADPDERAKISPALVTTLVS